MFTRRHIKSRFNCSFIDIFQFCRRDGEVVKSKKEKNQRKKQKKKKKKNRPEQWALQVKRRKRPE